MNRRLILMLAAAFLIAGCLPKPAPKPAPVPVPVPKPPPVVAGLVAALNAERTAKALPPLAEDPKLSAIAADWARSMAARGVMEHGAFAGRIWAGFPGRPIAEDIAMGQPDVTAVVAAWMASPPHRANILGVYRLAGVGLAVGPDGRSSWVVDFVE